MGLQERAIPQQQEPRARALRETAGKGLQQRLDVLLPFHPPREQDQPLIARHTHRGPQARPRRAVDGAGQIDPVADAVYPLRRDPVVTQIAHHLGAGRDEGVCTAADVARRQPAIDEPLLLEAPKVVIRPGRADLDGAGHPDAPRRAQADPGVELGVVTVDQVDLVTMRVDPAGDFPHPDQRSAQVPATFLRLGWAPQPMHRDAVHNLVLRRLGV
jgi:hypothetical protein